MQNLVAKNMKAAGCIASTHKDKKKEEKKRRRPKHQKKTINNSIRSAFNDY